MNSAALLRRLVAVADDLGAAVAVGASLEQRAQLGAVCRAARLGTGAAAASIARIDGDDLVYESSDGPGAEVIVGVRLPQARGIAGLVARTGQAMVVDGVRSDPRFARDIAERTGYVPETMLVVPISDDLNGVRGVVSVLDRGLPTTGGSADALALVSSLAELAAPVIASIDTTTRLAPLLLRALADAVKHDSDLAAALRLEARRRRDAGDTESIDGLTALLATARALGPDATLAAERLLGDFVEFAGNRRRR